MAEHEKQPPRELLDVPSTSRLERRLLVGDAQPQRPKRKPSIKPVPHSGLLGRLQAFLPSLQAANDQLQQQLAAVGHDQGQVAMERGSDDEREGPYVELDLACGLFDLKDDAAVAAAERSLAGQGVVVEAYGGGGTDSSDSGTDNEIGSSDSDGGDDDEYSGCSSSSSGGGEGSRAEGSKKPVEGTNCLAGLEEGQLAAGTAAAAAAVGQVDGAGPMEEDEAVQAVPAGATDIAGTAGAPAAAAGVAVAATRRGKKKGGQRGMRHAGIEELS